MTFIRAIFLLSALLASKGPLSSDDLYPDDAGNALTTRGGMVSTSFSVNDSTDYFKVLHSSFRLYTVQEMAFGRVISMDFGLYNPPGTSLNPDDIRPPSTSAGVISAVMGDRGSEVSGYYPASPEDFVGPYFAREGNTVLFEERKMRYKLCLKQTGSDSCIDENLGGGSVDFHPAVVGVLMPEKLVGADALVTVKDRVFGDIVGGKGVLTLGSGDPNNLNALVVKIAVSCKETGRPQGGNSNCSGYTDGTGMDYDAVDQLPFSVSKVANVDYSKKENRVVFLVLNAIAVEKQLPQVQLPQGLYTSNFDIEITLI